MSESYLGVSISLHQASADESFAAAVDLAAMHLGRSAMTRVQVHPTIATAITLDHGLTVESRHDILPEHYLFARPEKTR